MVRHISIKKSRVKWWVFSSLKCQLNQIGKHQQASKVYVAFFLSCDGITSITETQSSSSVLNKSVRYAEADSEGI